MKSILSSFSFLLLMLVTFVLLAVFRTDRLQQPHVDTSLRSSTAPNDVPVPAPGLRLLIGILTTPDRYERRHLLRLVYSLQPPPSDARVDVRFVLCGLTSGEQAVLVALEVMRYDDIIILDCAENMNEGKTYAYFSSLPSLFGADGDARPYDYVMKADDDIYLRLHQLVESLKGAPREDAYYGRAVPCDTVEPSDDSYMAGMAYAFSWDVVEWIAGSETARNSTVGREDQVAAGWMKAGNKGRHRINARTAMHNFPKTSNKERMLHKCGHDFTPASIGVHRLKNNARWASTLKYFNVTKGLKPSKLHRFP